MNLKGKKRMNLVLGSIALVIVTITFTRMYYHAKIETVEERYEAQLKEAYRTADEYFADYTVTLKDLNAADDEIDMLNNTIQKQEDEIAMLNDLIVSETKSNNPEKERLPEGPTNMFCYMDYKKLDNQTADQYWLQQECETNNLGIRTYGYYLCVAMGSAYGQNIGDTWRITLENGVSFAVILADCKGDDADSEFGHKLMNYDGQDCTNVIEFVVDKDEMYGDVKNAGTFSMCDIFGGLNGSGGNIKSIEYTGQVWKRG